jgi:hypothetical protein
LNQLKQENVLFLALIFILIPISLRNRNYPISLQTAFVGRSAIFGMKMLLFLKLNRPYKNSKNSRISIISLDII